VTRGAAIGLRAGIVLCRALRWVNIEVSARLQIDPEAAIIVTRGPWCLRREGGRAVALVGGGPVVTVAMDYGMASWSVVRERYVGNVAIIETFMPDFLFVLRRDEEAFGIEAERMIEKAREDRDD